MLGPRGVQPHFSRAAFGLCILLSTTSSMAQQVAGPASSGTAAPASQAAEGADPFTLQGPTALNGRIESTERIPGGEFVAIKLNDRNGLYLLSGNGRFVIKGAIYDLWGGHELTSLDEIRTAANTVNLKGLGVLWPDMKPMVFGDGPREIVMFVDPFCPYCAKLLQQVDALSQDGRYRFVVLTVPLLGERSSRAVRNLSCARDETAAKAALLTHSAETDLPQVDNCDLAPAQKRWVVAKVLQISGVPFSIRDDGRTVSGMPPDLASWLEGRS